MSESRYARQAALLAANGCFNDILAKSSVLVCGAGGLGCPAALYLAAAGLGRLGIIDYDIVSMSNLNRQILFNPSDLGKKKAPLAKERLEVFNPDIVIASYAEPITAALLDELLPQYDLMLDCTDNYPTRMLIAAAAFKWDKPTIVAGVRELEGFVLIVGGRESACLGCLYEKQPASAEPPQVLGAVAGTLGTLSAAQAMLQLTGVHDRHRNMLLLDTARLESIGMKLEKNSNCPICSSSSEQK